MIKKSVSTLFKRRAIFRHSSLTLYFSSLPKTPVEATPLSNSTEKNSNTSSTSSTISKEEKLSTDQAVFQNIGLQMFLKKTYKTTALSILGCLGSSYLVLSMPLTIAGIQLIAKCGAVAALIGIIGSSHMKPKIIEVV